MIPRRLRQRRFFGNLGLNLNSNPLRRQFDAIVAEDDRHGQWLAIRRAASLLDRLDIPHPGTEAGPERWRAFLAHVIDAAEDGDIGRARAVKATYKFEDQLGGFNAPSGAPSSEEDIRGPMGIDGPLIGESLAATDLSESGPTGAEAGLVAAREDPGAGIRIANLLSEANSRAEADDIFDVFNDAETKRNETAVYAAYAAALVRFGDLLDANGVLVSADIEKGLSKEELEDAMNRFFYPKDD